MIDIKDGATANISYTNFINSGYDLIMRNSADVELSNSNFSSFGVNSSSRAITVYYSTGDVSINNCTFTGSGQNGIGIYVNNTGTNVSISNNDFSDCRYGIRCYSSDAFLTGNFIEDSYYYGIQADYVSDDAEYNNNDVRSNFSSYSVYLNSSSPYLMYNDIINAKVLINGGYPYFATSPIGRGYNTITMASAPLLKIQNNSSTYMGYDYNGGYNSIFDTDLPHIVVYNNSGVWADQNYWGEEGPVIIVDGSSWKSDKFPLWQNPNLNKAADKDMVVSNSLSKSINRSEIESDFLSAIATGFKFDYVNAKEALQDLINRDNIDKFSLLSIVMYDHFTGKEISDVNSTRDKTIVKEELDGILNTLINLAIQDERRPVALRIKAKNAGISSRYSELSLYNNQIIKEYPNSNYELCSLYDEIAYQVEILNENSRSKLTRFSR